MKNKNFKQKKGIRFIFFLAVLAACIAITMFLWNALIPSIIGWSAITYWQAGGLLILCRLLFGGFGKPGMGHFRGGRGRNPFFDRLHSMSLEERKEFIRKRMSQAPWDQESSDKEKESSFQTKDNPFDEE